MFSFESILSEVLMFNQGIFLYPVTFLLYLCEGCAGISAFHLVDVKNEKNLAVTGALKCREHLITGLLLDV